jgi:hypothetical protein
MAECLRHRAARLPAVLGFAALRAWADGTNMVVRVPPPGAQAQGAAQATAPAKLGDIHGALEIADFRSWLVRLGMAAALAAILAGAWFWWRRRASEAKPEKVIPPGDRARARLAEALNLIDRPEPFCTAVSEAVRMYLEDRFGLRAPEQTTEEFLANLGDNPVIESGHQRLLEGFLTQCDLVKFARAEPGRPELEGMHAAALRLVNETSTAAPEPAPAPATPKPEATP